MKALRHTGISLVLLFAATASVGSMAAKLDKFRGDITVINHTPYTLKVGEHTTTSNRRGPMGSFGFSEALRMQDSAIAPGEVVHIGQGQSRQNELGGRILFRIEHTDASFYGHYSFGRERYGDTFVTLTDTQGGAPYPLVHIDPQLTLNKHKKFGGKNYDHNAVMVLSMDENGAACLANPDCTLESFKQSVTVSGGRVEL